MIKITNQNSKIVFIYILLLSIIYHTGSVPAALGIGSVMVDITRICMLTIPIFLFRGYSVFNKKGTIIVITIMMIGLVINSILFLDGFVELSYKAILFLEFLITYEYCSKKNLPIFEYLYKILILIITITLAMYLAIEVFHISIPFQYIGNTAYRSYLGIFYCYHGNGIVLPRLNGLFWEPGMYAIYLNIAFFLHIYEVKNKSRKDLIIILISILFCRSTAGICIGLFLFIQYIKNNNKMSKGTRWFTAITGFQVAAVIVVFLLRNKINLDSDTLQSYSYGLRVGDIINGLNIFIHNPIFGVGYGNNAQFVANDMFNRGSSNGLISWLYMTGIYGMFFALFPFFYKLLRKDEKQKMWFILIVLFNVFEPIFCLPIMPLFIAIEYHKTINREYRRINKN